MAIDIRRYTVTITFADGKSVTAQGSSRKIAEDRAAESVEFFDSEPVERKVVSPAGRVLELVSLVEDGDKENEEEASGGGATQHQVTVRMTSSRDKYSGTPASYDVLVNGQKVGELVGGYNRIAGGYQEFVAHDGRTESAASVRGWGRRYLDAAAIAAFEALAKDGGSSTQSFAARRAAQKARLNNL